MSQHPASLRVTEPEDVYLALTSYPPGDEAPAAELAQLRTAIHEAFGRGNGVLEVEKESGLFISNKAPEQLVADAEPRTDLYALGCLLYYALTARKAIADGAPNLRLATQGGMRLPKLDNVPVELRPILTRTLAMRPDDRFASAEELSQALTDTGLAS